MNLHAIEFFFRTKWIVFDYRHGTSEEWCSRKSNGDFYSSCVEKSDGHQSDVDSGDSERNTGYSDRRMDQKEEKNTKASKEVSDEKGFNSIYGGETAGI